MDALVDNRPAEKPMRAATADSRNDILVAAADCFKESGYSATSIDDVARSLKATKGMIYHHFRSKTDLFFAVYKQGMDINFAAIAPFDNNSDSALERLARMAYAHAVTMMAEQAFQRVQAQGVSMHLYGATTAAQRDTLKELIDIRSRYEAQFRTAIESATQEEGLKLENASLAVKSFLSVLNSTVYWYTPRGDNPKQEQGELAQEVMSYALRGLGLTPPTIEYSTSNEGYRDE